MYLRILSFLTVSAAAIGIIATSGCKKHNDDNSNTLSISATINGSVFKPQLNNALYGTVSHSWLLGGTAQNNGDTTLITIKLNQPVSLNTELGASGQTFLEYQDKGVQYLAGTGWGRLSFVVTALDSAKHTLAGSFSGVPLASNRRDSVVLTSGSFTATYAVVSNF
jgi:hypothetical protein